MVDGVSVSGTNAVGSFVGSNSSYYDYESGKMIYGEVSGYYHKLTNGFKGDGSATEVFTITLPENVTATGGNPITFGEKKYYLENSTVTLAITEPTITENASYVIAEENYTVTEDVTIDVYVSVDGGTYTNAVANILVIGSAANETLINTAANVTLDGGGGNDSLVGSDNTEIFIYSGGEDTIKNFTATDDKIRLAEGFSIDGNPQVDGENVSINFVDGGKLILESAANLETIELYNADGSNSTTYNVTHAEVVEENPNTFNNADPSKATSVVVNGTFGDFGTGQFNKMYSISSAQDNSMLVGNANNNTVVVTGGSDNILIGGLGKDTYSFNDGGGIVTDYGIGATKSGNGTTLATSTTANNFDRTNPTSYAGEVDVVKVQGKVSGIYFERDGNTKTAPTFTATIVYGDDNELIVLKDIVKKPTKTGSAPIYQTNDVAAATLKIWDTSGSKQAVLSAAKLKKLFHDDGDLSVEQQAQVTRLSELVEPENIITTSGEESTFKNPLATQIALNSNKPKN